MEASTFFLLMLGAVLPFFVALGLLFIGQLLTSVANVVLSVLGLGPKKIDIWGLSNLLASALSAITCWSVVLVCCSKCVANMQQSASLRQPVDFQSTLILFGFTVGTIFWTFVCFHDFRSELKKCLDPASEPLVPPEPPDTCDNYSCGFITDEFRAQIRLNEERRQQEVDTARAASTARLEYESTLGITDFSNEERYAQWLIAYLESAAHTEAELFSSLSPCEFEEIVATILRLEGYEAELTAVVKHLTPKNYRTLSGV